MRQDTYYRSEQVRRRPNTRRARTQYQASSGNGWLIIGIVGLLVVGMYYFAEAEQKQKVVDRFEVIKTQAISAVTTFFGDKLDPTQQEEEVPELLLASTPCTQANAVKMIVHTLMDEVAITPAGIGEAWYHPYYEVLQNNPKYAFLKEDQAMQPLTYQEAQQWLVTLLQGDYEVRLPMDATQAQKYITVDAFLKSYQQALAQSGQEVSTQTKVLSILGTPATHSALEAWEVATNEGIYRFEGLILDLYKDQVVKAVVKEDEILGVIEVVSNDSEVATCFVEKVEEDKVTLTIAGIPFVYKNACLTKAQENQTVSITLHNSRVIDYQLQTDETWDTILRVTEGSIEFEKAGVLQMAPEMLIYNGLEDANYQSIQQLFSGIKVTYTLQDGKVSSLKVVSDTVGDSIRVLLSEDGISEYQHEKVIVTCASDCNVTYGAQKLRLKAGDEWDISTFEWNDDITKIVIEPQDNQKIKVLSMTRQNKQPEYSGQLEVYKEPSGYYVINVLDMESYVAGVIPSEMPPSYGLEAAKVQAVAARSYAKAHQTNSKFAKYGAQVDDTTASQVYNNVEVGEQSVQAAEATKGQVMLHNNQIVSGNFFATSCGYTANYGETWGTVDAFPTHTPTYLTSEPQYNEQEAVDFSDEEKAYAFFTATPEAIDAFDNHSPWFRWQVSMTGEELSASINHAIGSLAKQNPSMIQVYNSASDTWQTKAIEEIGAVKALEVVKRGSGGNAMEVIAKGDAETIKVSTEYLIRCLLAPKQTEADKAPIQVERADGSTVDNMAMLPSGFFSLDATSEDDKLETLTIYGGGFGHGVGMSQDGVKGMVERGYDYETILEHYYSQIEVTDL